MTQLADAYQGITKREYSPKEDTYAVISPEQKKLGRVKEISLKGLTFDYIDESQNPSRFEEFRNPHQQVDIFIKKKGYYLRNLPTEKLIDMAVVSTPTFCQLPMRQIRVEFGPLNDAQRRKLEYLMMCYDVHDAI